MRIKNIQLTFILLVCCFSHLFAQSTQLINPILAGFYPDPSIIKVKSDYYLINSTFSYFPGIPVFHSKDLKNWKQITSAINRPSQMNFMGDRVTRGLFAPAIDYHNGIYYITCTMIDHGGNFVITAKNPAGPWSDPVWLPAVKGIDPSLCFDGDKAYVIYNSDAPDNHPLYPGHRTIKAYEFDPIQLKMVGEPRLLVNGGVDISKKPVWIEGPHIMKLNNWYYLYAAEGGTSVNHSEVIFRSKSVLGPYVPYEHNPILTQRDLPAERKNPITSAGHAQFVEGPDGKTYVVFLAVRPYQDDYYNTGRETFIAPVKWENDWPVITSEAKAIQYAYTVNYKEVKQKNSLPHSGNFSYTFNFNHGLDPSLLFLRTYDSSWFNIDRTHGLVMKLKPETCMEKGNPAFIGMRQQHLNCSASTEMIFNAKNENEKAGILIFQDEKHFYYLCKSIDNNQPVIQLFQSIPETNSMKLLAQQLLKNTQTPLLLKIKASGDSCNFYYGHQPEQWTLLKSGIDARFLSTHIAGGFVGCLFALYATSSNNITSNTVNFKSLKYSGDDPVFTQIQ